MIGMIIIRQNMDFFLSVCFIMAEQDNFTQKLASGMHLLKSIATVWFVR